MVDTCSICSTKTFHLTSLFVTDDGKKWRDSGLLKMVEVCKRIKIIKSVKKIPMICNPCIYKISKSFYNINNHKNHQDKRTVVCETIKSSDESKIPAVEENKNTDYIKEKSQLNKRPRNESHDNAIRKKLCQRNEEIIEPVIKQDLINNLDNDCLAKIFLYLPTIELFYIEQVCQRWKLVVQLAWQDTKKYIDNLYKNCNLLKQLHIEKIINRCGHHLNHLVLSKNCDSSIIKIIADNCHNLVRLELKFKTINENNFTRVFSRMAKLKVIKIEDNRDRFNTNDHITHILDSIPEGIEEIFFHSACNAFEHFNAIRLISLQHCEFGLDLMQKISLKKTIIYIDFEKSVLKSGLPLLSNLINLKHLNLDFVMGCTSEALVHITDECKNIKYLNLSACLGISNNALINIKKLINLESLYLQYLQNVNENVLTGIIENCKNLKCLNIAACSSIPGSVLDEINRLNKLEKLVITRLDNATDFMLIGFYNLKILRCSRCTNITDCGIMFVIQNCHNLEDLRVDETGVTDKSIHCAVEQTKLRKNNVVLQLVISLTMLKKIDDSINTSSFLKILSLP
ncbi:hypothetical protein HCN44_001253 [Aphidius gifuensis]|uniref:F-box domain-containing protein n=1 Tax=Aphidius gifuensis TaxID=684658 RepID=A0A834XKN8_APHGI|nr:hypothetical protein HCN44_001253 [Aphidius gifuensis]